MESARMEETECPECGVRLDAATCLTGGGQPREGDYTVCMYCGVLLRFGEGRVQRRLTDDELVELALEQPREFRLLLTAQNFIGETRRGERAASK